MNSLFLYLLQSGISLIILYGIYWLFLRKDTFFQVNRFYLILSVVFSFALPLFSFSFPLVKSSSEYIYLLEKINISTENISESINRHWNIFEIIGIVYIIGVGIFLIRFIVQLFHIGFLVHKYGMKRSEGLNLVITNPRFSPFSFFNMIFLSNDISDQDTLDKIIAHEKIHIQQKHSFDIVLLELFTIIQWFNPFMWFYKNSLKNIHEFLADEGVLIEGINKIDYQELLLSQSIGFQLNGISNNFSPVRMAWPGGQSLIKRRLIMMSKSKSHKFMLVKMLFILPLALFLTVFFSVIETEKLVAQTDKTSSDIQNTQEEQVFTTVEKMPEYPGGDEAQGKIFSREC